MCARELRLKFHSRVVILHRYIITFAKQTFSRNDYLCFERRVRSYT